MENRKYTIKEGRFQTNGKIESRKDEDWKLELDITEMKHS